ncbi:MAG: response regulator [Candidatus Saccharimonadales bacterium]
MAKVLLVEDDNNLREIYEARLTAEGYDIVAAQNGEDALVLAKQHHPDLVISDVMMPRISGYEMLDILRNTEELKHTKVIMLTALGQNEDKERAGKLGADKYLVKSQVTLEDIVNSAKALLADDSVGGMPQVATPDPADPLGMGTTSQTDDVTAMPSVSPVAATVAPLSPVIEPVAVAEPTPAVQPEVLEPPQPVTVEPLVAPSTGTGTGTGTNTEATTTAVVSEPTVATVETVAPAPLDTNSSAEQPTVSAASPLAEPVSIDSLINGAPITSEAVAGVAQPNTETVQPTENEQAVVDQQIASFDPQPLASTLPVQPEMPVNSEQQSDATLNNALQTLTAEEPLSDTSSTIPASSTDTPNEEVQSHGIEGLSGVNEVVEVPVESLVNPMPSASVAQPVAEQAVTQMAEPTPTAPETTPMTQTFVPTEMPQTPAQEPVVGPDNDGVNVVGKKVIQPLSDPNAKPDLDKLLAQEEALQSGEALPQPGANEPATPPATTATKPANGFDPNNIAL